MNDLDKIKHQSLCLLSISIALFIVSITIGAVLIPFIILLLSQQ